MQSINTRATCKYQAVRSKWKPLVCSDQSCWLPPTQITRCSAVSSYSIHNSWYDGSWHKEAQSRSRILQVFAVIGYSIFLNPICTQIHLSWLTKLKRNLIKKTHSTEQGIPVHYFWLSRVCLNFWMVLNTTGCI